MSVKSEERLET